MSDDAGGLPEGEAENSATADESVSIAEQIASLDRRADVISTPISTWLEDVEFETTEDIPIPERLVDQVIGQEDASIVIRKASEQRRHVMMIGDPGTGKSMLAKSMTELLPSSTARSPAMRTSPPSSRNLNDNLPRRPARRDLRWFARSWPVRDRYAAKGKA